MQSSRVFALVALLAVLPIGSRAAKPLISDSFTVEFSPRLVEPVYEPEASPPYYLWAFETRITNNFDFPVRIKEFTSLSRSAGKWLNPQKPYGAKEFTEWYTDGDPVDDGWIQPGAVSGGPRRDDRRGR